jgi:HK97 family phage portal protein
MVGLIQRVRNALLALKSNNPTGASGSPALVPGVGQPWASLQAQPSPGLALRASAVWACVNLISKAVAGLPAQVVKVNAGKGTEPAVGHPLYTLLTRAPNAMMTLQQFLQPSMLHLLLWGNAFTWLDRIEGEVIALWPLLPSRMRINYTSANTIEYVYFDLRGRPSTYTPGVDMIPFRVFSLDGYLGLSVLQYQQLALEFQDLSQMYALNLYRNGGRPNGVLEYPGQLIEKQVDKIRASWKAIHGGVSGAGEVAILENGAKYAAVDIPPETLQYIDTQKFSVEQIARIFGVPPHLIGAMDKPTYASVEQQSIEFLRYTLQPYVRALETSIDSALLEEPYHFRLDMNAFERTDIRSRYAAYAVGRQWGWLSVNDIRAVEAMNGIGEDGDIYLQPLNMAPADASVELVPPAIQPIPNPQQEVPQ